MSQFEVQQFANKRPFIYVDRWVFAKSNKERGLIYTFKKELGKTKHHKFETVLKVSF